jgi:hypothetical protein
VLALFIEPSLVTLQLLLNKLCDLMHHWFLARTPGQTPLALRVMPRSLPVFLMFALAAASHFNAAAAPSPAPLLNINSDVLASAEHDVAQWIPWFDLGVAALSSNSPDIASRAFLISARLSGNPAAWSNVGFSVTKMRGGPHPRMLHYFAAAFRGSRDASAAVFFAQAMILLGMNQRALDFTTLFLTRRCGRSSSNCVWQNGKPKIMLHSGAAADAVPDMCAAPSRIAQHLAMRAPSLPTLFCRCSISTCSRQDVGSVIVFWFDTLQQICSRWPTRQQDAAFFHRSQPQSNPREIRLPLALILQLHRQGDAALRKFLSSCPGLSAIAVAFNYAPGNQPNSRLVAAAARCSRVFPAFPPASAPCPHP